MQREVGDPGSSHVKLYRGRVLAAENLYSEPMGWKPIALDKHKTEADARNCAFERVEILPHNVFLGF